MRNATRLIGLGCYSVAWIYDGIHDGLDIAEGAEHVYLG